MNVCDKPYTEEIASKTLALENDEVPRIYLMNQYKLISPYRISVCIGYTSQETDKKQTFDYKHDNKTGVGIKQTGCRLVSCGLRGKLNWLTRPVPRTPDAWSETVQFRGKQNFVLFKYPHQTFYWTYQISSIQFSHWRLSSAKRQPVYGNPEICAE